jgi:three-Cys-motif partner protein
MQQFGGNWSRDKLERISKYLQAYATIMNKQNFRYAYIDAFAGTGYQTLKTGEQAGELLFPELVDEEPQRFLEGSARIALQIQPRFTKYIFVEKDPKRFLELEHLREEFPEVSNDIILINEDCNAYLKELCLNYAWRKNRAVLFLDPFGMQVRWETIEAIAATKAIDLWILFPLGVAVNRMLRRDGNISPKWQERLNELFGTLDWYDAFYVKSKQPTLFGEEEVTEKISDFDSIGRFFISRLQEIFAGVVDNPLFLRNSKNIPLYMLCFAAENQRGAKTAVKIASDILKD